MIELIGGDNYYYIYHMEIQHYNMRSSGVKYAVSFDNFKSLKDQDIFFLKEHGFSYFKSYGRVCPIEDFDLALQKIYEEESFREKEGLSQLKIYFYKTITKTDITSFYRLKTYLLIDGVRFEYINPLRNGPLKHEFSDRFYLMVKSTEQLDVIKRRNFEYVPEPPEYRGDHVGFYAPKIQDINGYIVEKRYCDIADFGKEYKPKLIGNAESLHIEPSNCEGEVVEFLSKHGLLES